MHSTVQGAFSEYSNGMRSDMIGHFSISVKHFQKWYKHDESELVSE